MAVTIFLDVDEVLAIAGVLQPELVQNLNNLIAKLCDVRIVMNTSWNSLPLDSVRAAFKMTGFAFADTIVDQTDATSGGGAPIRRYFMAHPEIHGEPYIIIDDGARDLGCMWGRLVKCMSPEGHPEGFTKERVQEALAVLNRDVSDEREAAVMRITKEMHRVMVQCPWMTLNRCLETRARLASEQRRIWITAEFEFDAFLVAPPLCCDEDDLR